MQVLVHDTSDNCLTWAPHGVGGWYLRPAPDHYQCHLAYIPHTCAERIAKTVEFFPHDCPVPAGSSTSSATAAARALNEALFHPTPTPFATLGDDQFSAIQTLLRVFSNVTENTQTAPAPKAPRPAPADALKIDCPAPYLRLPTLTPPELTPRVTMVPATQIPNNSPPKPVPIAPAQCIRQPTPTPTPAIIEPKHDYPVLNLRYNLQPRPRPSPYNRWQGGTQPRYVAAFGHLIHQEEQANVVIDPTSGQALEYRHLICGPNGDTWIRALANDLGCLAQGVGTRMSLLRTLGLRTT